MEIVVVPAVADNAEPDPLFFLAGGPGQAATELAGPMARLLARVRRTRDLVLVDQRGTGGADRMRCVFFESGPGADESNESLQIDALPLDRVRECLDEIEANTDPRHYTTPVAMDDLDEVRAVLGYETINLLGGSYGTRAGLVYMRRHPERVRTAVLDGLAPVSMRLPSNMSSDAHDALDRLFADCEADTGCRDAFPDLPRTFASVMADLEANPRALGATHPRTGEAFETVLTASRFAADLRAVLYYPELASLLPWTVVRAAAGDFAPYLAQSVPLNEFSTTLNAGVFLSVICAEDVSQLDADAAARLAAGSVLGRESIVAWIDACTVWPAADLPAGYFEPVRSDVPTLLLSGALDPVTPPRWGEEVLRGLGNARHVVAPGAGHGVITRGCTADVVARFIDAGSHTNLDIDCIEQIRRPPFMLSPGRDRAMIEVRGLARCFGDVVAVDGVSFTAGDGRITGLLGPNGAGKTTTLRTLYGLLRPDAGTAMVDGVNAVADPRAVQRLIGVLPDAHGLYVRLTAREHLRYVGELHALDAATIAASIERLVELLDMGGIIDRRVEGVLDGRAHEGRRGPRAGARSAEPAAGRAYQRPRRHEHAGDARPDSAAQGPRQVRAALQPRHAGGLGLV